MSGSNRQQSLHHLYGIMGQPIKSTNMGRVYINIVADYSKEHGYTVISGNNLGDCSKNPVKDKHESPV